MTADYSSSFSSLSRLYGANDYALLQQLRICVVGIGGVGSWTVEALARTGIGHITMIDHDDVTPGNLNRQLHALQSTIGQSKVELMKTRVLEINPDCDIVAEDDFLAEKNLFDYLLRDFDMVIDAIDSIRFKAALIYFCKRNKVPVITTGGAGGRVDPGAVAIADLSVTWNDALAAKVRSRLRAEYGYTSNPKRRFGVPCVYSNEQPVYPKEGGQIGHAKPGVPGASLDCEQGYGSVSFVTGTFGFLAAAYAVNRALELRRRKLNDANAV